MEKEYAVIVKKGVDIEAFDAEMSASQGHGPIPDRSVDIANPRLGSRRMTHWMITDEEAEQIRQDSRVLAVEIPPDQRDDIKMVLRASQTGDFQKLTTSRNDAVNWALKRCIEELNPYGINVAESFVSTYDYAVDGTGVDVVIQDSGIEVNHPEWQDSVGNSRLQLIDWYQESGLVGTQNANHYRDFDGHGTHTAGVIAGKTYGWAKGAHIYSQKLDGLAGAGDSGTGIPTADAFDSIRLWHANKTNGRPTVVNMSWGYISSTTASVTGGTYQGVSWSNTLTDAQLWQNYGIVIPIANGGTTRIIPARNVFADTEVEDMIDAGIHVCIAAGNDYYKHDVPGGIDYDNEVFIDGLTYTYHRGSSPYSDRAFNVGAIDIYSQDVSGDLKEKVAQFSTRGPAIDIWSPGVGILSACSITNQRGDIPYLFDENFTVIALSGTSEASPQVAGVCALHLQVFPNLTPVELKARLLADAKDTVYDTGSPIDYINFNTTLLGATNKFLYSRYGVPYPYTATNVSLSRVKLNT